MTKTDRIIENVNATMAMEDMPLTEDNKQTIRRYLDGTESFEDVLASVIQKYAREKVMG
jgi:hypothetical protein